MKIAIHSNQFDGRGTGKVLQDYASGLQNIFGFDVVCVTSALSKNERLSILQTQFQTVLYDKKEGVNPAAEVRDALSQIVQREKIDFFHMIKAGEDDHINPVGCEVGVHCVFNMAHPHGDIYAGVSEYLAKVHSKVAYIPHIIRSYPPTENLRQYWSIPKDAMVFGRHGGMDTFDLPFVHQTIAQILQERNDVYFVFMATTPFIRHERVLFLPWEGEPQKIFNFIHSCDAMIHGRSAGETFGLAVGEFSAANKPVITNLGGYDKAHLEHLGERALGYSDGNHLLEIFRQIDKAYIADNDWDVFSDRFSEKNVMNKYKEIFLP